MSIYVKVKIDIPKMKAVVGGISEEALMRGANRAKERARGNVFAAGRVDSGEMANSMQVKLLRGRDPLHPAAVIGTPVSYAKYQEYGTRAHGPVRARYLRFKPKGSTTFVFAKWVRGVTPAKFMQKTLDEVRPSDFT